VITISLLLLSKRKRLRTQGHTLYLPIILACDVASLGTWLPIFWDKTVVFSWLVDIAKKNVLFDIVNLEYQTTTFSRNASWLIVYTGIIDVYSKVLRETLIIILRDYNTEFLVLKAGNMCNW